MRDYRIALALAFGAVSVASGVAPGSALAAIEDVGDVGERSGPSGSAIDPATNLPLECVPFARSTSGIQIYGDAYTWWGQARDRYATGRTPRVGAVMAIRPHNNSKLGHVATVSRIVDSRTVLLTHANWSSPGQIERNVTALDVSPGNDWSQVRIWYAPSRTLGVTHWPVEGFIYNAKPGAIRAAKASGPAKPLRRNDPIGAIIAGTY